MYVRSGMPQKCNFVQRITNESSLAALKKQQAYSSSLYENFSFNVSHENYDFHAALTMDDTQYYTCIYRSEKIQVP